MAKQKLYPDLFGDHRAPQGTSYRASVATIRRRRTCEWCDKPFVMHKPGGAVLKRTTKQGRFCSSHCRAAMSTDGKSCPVWCMLCVVCGGAFVKRNGGSARTCGPACAEIRYRKQTRVCRICGSQFETTMGAYQRLCSEECHAAAEVEAKTAAKRARREARAQGRDPRKYRHRAKKHGVSYDPTVTRSAVFERDGWRCQVCGRKTPKRLNGTFKDSAPELDHRIPMSQGGAHSWANCQCSCRSCNLTKAGHSIRGQMHLALLDQPKAQRGQGRKL